MKKPLTATVWTEGKNSKSKEFGLEMKFLSLSSWEDGTGDK